MVGHQLGLHHRHLRELGLQGLGNPLVVALARSPQQGRIGRLLDQGMLEDIRRLWWEPPLVEELRLHQLVQPPLQGPLVPRGDGLQQVIGKLAPQCGPQLRQALDCCQAV